MNNENYFAGLASGVKSLAVGLKTTMQIGRAHV